MASVNKVILIGNLGRDPELRYMENGRAVANVSIATTRNWKDKESGEKQEETEWHRLVFYDRLAEIAGEYLKKGKPVYVEGRLKTRKWQDKEGRDTYTTEVIIDQMQLLGGRDSGGDGDSDEGQGRQGGGNAPAQKPASGAGQRSQAGNSRPPASKPAPQATRTGTGFDDMDDDIPF